ncbi:hypothetical protein [Streptomyces sp. NPDC001404]|uniref:hypothetical protein n=1 Tax=Streptomyces sp. NPDC001404 TaxID=3364571 RepID=UPI00368C9894
MNLSTQQRGDLAEQLLPYAGRLAAYVRGDGGVEDIERLLKELDDQQRTGLLVVLAGLVNPDEPLAHSLGWLEFNERGETIVPTWNEDTSLRDLADELPLETAAADIDEIAVARFLDGDTTVSLTRAEHLQVIIAGRESGMTFPELDTLFGTKSGTAHRFLLRARRAAEARGEALELKVAPPKRLSEKEVVAMREAAAAGVDDAELALTYDLSRPNVSRVVTGQSYQQYGGPRRSARPQQSQRWNARPRTRASA